MDNEELRAYIQELLNDYEDGDIVEKYPFIPESMIDYIVEDGYEMSDDWYLQEVGKVLGKLIFSFVNEELKAEFDLMYLIREKEWIACYLDEDRSVKETDSIEDAIERFGCPWIFE